MSGFQHSCFISYRHGDINDSNDTLNNFAEQVKEALASEIKAQLNKPVFFDTERLKGGYILNPVIGTSVCQSVCMIVIFVRDYLSENNPYCAAELRLMLECEEKRLQHFGQNVSTAQKGHIITLAYRNPDLVPDVLKSRIFYDFSKHTSADVALRLNPNHAAKFVEMADFIADLYEEMEQHQATLCQDCLDKTIPDLKDPIVMADISAFVKKHRKRRPSQTLQQS